MSILVIRLAQKLGHSGTRQDDDTSCHDPPMGFLDKIFARTPKQPEAAGGLVKLSGTTTTCSDAMSELAQRYSISSGGYLELAGTLQREPNNAVDPNAVAVMVEGARVGYLPGHMAAAIDLSLTGASAIRVQVFTEVLPKGLRAEAWAWLGSARPQWEFTESNRPPMSSRAKSIASHEDRVDMVNDAVAGGGVRAAQFTAGMVKGVHFLELVEPIKQLKRDGQLEEALTLCYAAIEGAEADRRGREPAPFYTEQAAIILRKLGRGDEEIAVLERWLALCPPKHRDGTRIGERLAKLR
jgi:hypothetical protein